MRLPLLFLGESSRLERVAATVVNDSESAWLEDKVLLSLSEYSLNLCFRLCCLDVFAIQILEEVKDSPAWSLKDY